MRLLHTRTLELSDFNDQDSMPYYAILSHTWGEDEFVFSDYEKLDRRSSSGWRKIVKCCELAAADGWEYAWVDTCCIDKSSSAELTEAINSMWRWYQDSQICYVHLADYSISRRGRNIRKSRWFTRGWTLQELLAPERVIFYDLDWQEIGSISYLQHDISHICRIDPDHLANPIAASVATKMSWASRRKTTRKEDLAYSLLGLFDINMALIYGEGDKAFFRLQSEIIRSSTDQSIFTWTSQVHLDFQKTGMLAPNVACFADSNGIVPKHFQGIPQTPYQMTNHGLQIEFGCIEAPEDTAAFLSRNLEPDSKKRRKRFRELAENLRMSYFDSRQPSDPHLWLVRLPCVRATHEKQPIALIIYRSHKGQYARVSPHLVFAFKKSSLDNSTLRCESMSFLISNTGIPDLDWLLDWHFGTINDIGCSFVEFGQELQQKLHHAENLHLDELKFGKPLTNLLDHSQSPSNLCLNVHKRIEIHLIGGIQLTFTFSTNFISCSIIAASAVKTPQKKNRKEEEDCEQRATKEEIKEKLGEKPLMAPYWYLSPHGGTYQVTLKDTDESTLPFNDEHQIVIRTRRVFCEAPGHGNLHCRDRETPMSCAIRLYLRALPKTELPALRA